VVARCDAPVVLDFVEELLDEIALAVESAKSQSRLTLRLAFGGIASATISGAPPTRIRRSPISGKARATGARAGTTWRRALPAISAACCPPFFQFAEQDEGNIFRVVASFTDSSGQLIATTSAPTTTNVGDIAPIVTQPFSFALDEFKVVKGTNTFEDTFTQRPPPVSGVFGPNLLAFNTNNGSIVPEVNSRAILTATDSTPNATLASTDSTGAVLLTNTQPEGTGSGQSELGLKEDQTWTFSGTYDLATPGIATYGIELLNGGSSTGNTQVVQLVVQADNTGATDVKLFETNPVTGVHTLPTSQTLTSAQLASNTQIELDLAHNTVNNNVITASFELFTNGTQTFSQTLAPSTPATEFSTTTFVQTAVFASSPPSADSDLIRPGVPI
jgi:hypothetical protein